jgi:hypothetical protein
VVIITVAQRAAFERNIISFLNVTGMIRLVSR